jgi:hypothetical protein
MTPLAVPSFSRSFNDIVSHSVSFVHLNIQSIVPKLDLISAEFICHDIISFTESWLTPRVSDNDMIIPAANFIVRSIP